MTWRATETEKKKAPPWAHFIGGGLGGLFGAVITCPLEVVKTRLQAQRNKTHLVRAAPFGLNTFYAMATLLRQEGFFCLV